MNYFKKTIIALFILTASYSARAQQKIAHLNSAEVMQKMKEYKIAEMTLDSFQKALAVELDELKAEYKRKLDEYTLADKTKMSEAMKQSKEQDLADMETRINNFTQKAQTDLQKMQSDLLETIQKKLQKVIEVVAKEKGYAYVLDDSALLVKPDGDDISVAVVAKLGINEPVPTPTPVPTPKK
jgi:outer membrane protein